MSNGSFGDIHRKLTAMLELPMPYPRAMESAEMVALRAKLWGEVRDESLRAMGER